MEKKQQFYDRFSDGEISTLLKLDSIMDLRKASELEKKIEKIALEGNKRIYLDFSEVDFLCAYMMRIFIKFHKTWGRAGVRLGIKDSNSYCDNTLKIAGLEDMFTLH